MSFSYRTLIPQVRRLINDTSKVQIDSISATASASYFIVANQDAYIVPVPSGILIDGTVLPSDQYTVLKNIIRSNVLINAGSNVVMQYSYTAYTDDMIADSIGDTIHNTIEPIFNTSFGFVGESTEQTIDQDLKALFVQGTAIQIMGDKLTAAGDDAIYIKDGDTVIDTATANRERSRSFDPMYKRWQELLQTVRSNRFRGITMV